MPIIILTIAAQLFCAYHVVSSGRDKYWIGLIIMVPGLGCLIYLVTQIIPDASNSTAGRNVKQGAVNALDPNRALREAIQAFDMVESVDNRLRLADALYDLGQFREAEPHLKICLDGAHQHDPHILMRLASVQLELGAPTECLQFLDTLQEHNKNYHSEAGHLLYSRALVDTGDLEAALSSYAGLVDYSTGEEARVRYGLLLLQSGKNRQARQVLEEVIKRVNRGTKFYKKAQRSWRDQAQAALADC